MSQFNAIGEYGLNDVLTKRLTTPGGSNAPSVAPEIFPVLTLENDRPEWSYLKGERRMARFCNVAALAANYSMVQLYLPTTARTIAVITQVDNQSNILLVARLVGISGGLGGWAARTTCGLDTRQTGNGSSLIIETNQNAVHPTNFGTAFLMPAGTTLRTPLTLAPGGSFGFFVSTLNAALDLNVSWYERPAQPGELA